MRAENSLSLVQPLRVSKYQHIRTYFDEKYHTNWCYMHAEPRPCFTPLQLRELARELNELRERRLREGSDGVRYNVIASDVEGVFSLGGDLDLFKRLIAERDKEALTRYALACIENVHMVTSNFKDSGIVNLTLVQGLALGGGMECALAADAVIAERGSQLGLPEVVFNLFPGMGAYSILSRKLNPSQARQMILSGRVFSAEELHEMGVVDVLAEPGEGELAVYEYIKKYERASNTHRALARTMHRVNPVSYEELRDVALIWVDAAMNLERRDLRMMDRLVRRQSKDWRCAAAV